MRHLSTFLLGLLLLSVPVTLSAAVQADDPAAQCLEGITERVLQQQRIFRGVLYGVLPAADELEGSTRYDEVGNAWIKVGLNHWASASTTQDRSDDQVDANTEWAGMNDPNADPAMRTNRPGILQTRGGLTSDLLPEVVRAYRTFQCRLAMVCAAVQQNPEADGPMPIKTAGCAPLQMEPIRQCAFANAEVNGAQTTLSFIDPQSDSTVRLHCDPLIEQVAQDEARMVSLGMSYDSAVRSIFQFAGQFDSFLDSWRGDVLTPLEQTVSLVHQLSRIPCFLSQCTR